MSDTKTGALPAAKPNRKLLERQFTVAENVRQEIVIMPEIGTTMEEMQNPAYWSHVASRLRAWDRIEVRPADGTWWAELVVRVVQPFAVRVHVLRLVKFPDAQRAAAGSDVPPGYVISQRGARGWTVVRETDNEVLKDKEQTRGHAVAWLDAYLAALGQKAA